MKQAKKKATRAGRGKVADARPRTAWALVRNKNGAIVEVYPVLTRPEAHEEASREYPSAYGTYNALRLVRVRITPIPPKRRAAR